MPQSQTEDQLTHREEETHDTGSHNIIKNKATSSLFLSRSKRHHETSIKIKEPTQPTQLTMNNTPDRRLTETFLTTNERGSTIARNSVFDCYLSPFRQGCSFGTAIYLFNNVLSVASSRIESLC